MFLNFFFPVIFCSQGEGKWEIQTSDLCFMRCAPQPIKLPLRGFLINFTFLTQELKVASDLYIFSMHMFYVFFFKKKKLLCVMKLKWYMCIKLWFFQYLKLNLEIVTANSHHCVCCERMRSFFEVSERILNRTESLACFTWVAWFTVLGMPLSQIHAWDTKPYSIQILYE